MTGLLQDLYGHQAWADAEHCRAIEAHAPARDDEAIRRRLHHLHFVQRAFMWAVGDRAAPFAFSKPEDFRTFGALKAFARESHASIDRLLSGLAESRLAEQVSMPWFEDPPADHHGRRDAGPVCDAQPVASRPERDAAARARRHAAHGRSDRLVLARQACAGVGCR